MKPDLHNQLDNTAPRPVAPENDIAQPHPKHAEAMNIFKSFTKQRRMDITTDIKEIVEGLAPVVQTNQFPEALFLQHFFPFFIGDVPATQLINNTTWIDKVAGSSHNPVDIIDAAGQVLFTVPPMFDTSVLDQAQSGGQTMTLVERHYSRLKEIDVSGSQQFLKNTLSSIHVKDKPTEQLYANFRAWNDILIRYGRADRIIEVLPLDKDPNKDKPTAASNNPTSDLADYDLDTD